MEDKWGGRVLAERERLHFQGRRMRRLDKARIICCSVCSSLALGDNDARAYKGFLPVKSLEIM